MIKVPEAMLQFLYTRSSLRNDEKRVAFSLKNRLKDATISNLICIKINEKEIPLSKISSSLNGAKEKTYKELSAKNPIHFLLNDVLHIFLQTKNLPDGDYTIFLEFETEEMGVLRFEVQDSIIQIDDSEQLKIPRNSSDDYGVKIIKERQNFVDLYAGAAFDHVTKYSFDAHETRGNIENFIGVAQVPIGIAGPIKINGEHTQGEFLIPMATTEGTLVASYNRGIKILNLCGGATCTLVDDAMQRAPVFVFDNARAARDFVVWVLLNEKEIKAAAEETTNYGKLSYIDYYLASKFAYLRFNYTTGDAAGQNLVGRATFAACTWIMENHTQNPIRKFYLESNLATDKKASQINVMKTRGKRVTAECILKKEILKHHLRVEPKELLYHHQVANIGTILSGANNNGLHSANAITAMFIATGQDVANVSECSAGILHTELTPEGDFYISITIPSLIVATHGGGTGLPTQRECLEVMNCYGKDNVGKLAEIMAGVVLAGEISLAAAISSSDWVSSHEQYGRNR